MHDHRSPNEPKVKLASLSLHHRLAARRFYRSQRSVGDRRRARYVTLNFALEARRIPDLMAELERSVKAARAGNRSRRRSGGDLVLGRDDVLTEEEQLRDAER